MSPMLPVLCVLLAAPLCACLWDRDTLAQEARGLPEVEAIIAGRFERNVPAYYEMRIKRISEFMESRWLDLDAYDDIAVASDRLGKSDEALAWMEKKRRVMESHKEQFGAYALADHWYRYRANTGTFHAHRWFAKGADRANMKDLELARDFVKAAIAGNPNAHFGREKYQLMAIEWVLTAKPLAADAARLPDFLGLGWSHRVESGDALQKRGLGDAATGICGLVVQGAAWNSVDVFFALAVVLSNDGRQSLAQLALMRARELVASGSVSFVPGAPKGAALLALLGPAPQDMLSGQQSAAVESEFKRLRSEADAWAKARDEYMLARFKHNRHPDTDPNFWTDYREAPFVPTVDDDEPASQTTLAFTFATMGGALLLMAVLGGLAVFITRRHQAAPQMKDM